MHHIHHYDELCSIGEKLILPKGFSLQDQLGDDGMVFVLDSGVVTLSGLTEQGNQQTIMYLSPRWLIGIVPSFLPDYLFKEEGFCAVEHYTRTDCVVYQVTRKRFSDFIKRHPLFAESVISVLAINLHLVNKHYFQMQDLSVFQRLCNVLLDLDKGRGSGIESFFTAEELGNYIGSHPVTISKIIAELKRQNIVSRKGRRLFIEDRDHLLQIVRERKQYDY